MKNKMFWMILACIIPLLVVILLPVFGIKNEFIAFIAIVLMFAVHLFMMDGHSDKKGDNHEHT